MPVFPPTKLDRPSSALYHIGTAESQKAMFSCRTKSDTETWDVALTQARRPQHSGYNSDRHPITIGHFRSELHRMSSQRHFRLERPESGILLELRSSLAHQVSQLLSQPSRPVASALPLQWLRRRPSECPSRARGFPPPADWEAFRGTPPQRCPHRAVCRAPPIRLPAWP